MLCFCETTWVSESISLTYDARGRTDTQVNRVQSVMLELDKMLEFNSYDEDDQDIPFEEQLSILITDLGLRVNTQQLARIMEQTEDPRYPNFLSVTALASSTTFRTLVQQNHRLQLDEDFEEENGPVNSFVLKEAFSMIDEAFAIFDPNGNGLIELEEMQEFWGVVKHTLSGGGTLQALFTSKVCASRFHHPREGWDDLKML